MSGDVAAEAPPVTHTILLVEDEPAIRRLFAQSLRLAGYTVMEARNGAEALSLFEGAGVGIDLLIADVRMPLVSGAELAGKLASRRTDRRTLFVTGYAEALELGPNAMLLQKPFVRADLLRAVRSMLDRSASKRSGSQGSSAEKKYGGNRPERKREP